ncbi:YbaB/EbfC family nucleoid-associated protein [Amycolatopsis orientalis]|uniref:YbaB/EbfC family nucleoid-associated protein n=1 Tax=Amycolatopsis orientalis TaxID=31958 RepID=UPI001F3CDD0C|nr:YbaB/EbfC family nucleoid-associated protein [Amycolatopsis orientalis]
MSLNVVRLRQQAGELDAELERARFIGRSADGVASAVVTGQGKLVDLTIADQVIRSSHPQRLGPAVVEAVSAARRAAAQVGVAKVRAVVDKDQEWMPEPAPGPAATQGNDVAPSPAPRTATAAEPRGARPDSGEVEEESFDQLDFLDDDLEDEGRDRW